MLVSLPILVTLRCIIYHWKWIHEHFLIQVQSYKFNHASSILQIHLVIHEILADKAFTATDSLISQSLLLLSCILHMCG